MGFNFTNRGRLNIHFVIEIEEVVSLTVVGMETQKGKKSEKQDVKKGEQDVKSMWAQAYMDWEKTYNLFFAEITRKVEKSSCLSGQLEGEQKCDLAVAKSLHHSLEQVASYISNRATQFSLAARGEEDLDNILPFAGMLKEGLMTLLACYQKLLLLSGYYKALQLQTACRALFTATLQLVKETLANPGTDVAARHTGMVWSCATTLQKFPMLDFASGREVVKLETRMMKDAVGEMLDLSRKLRKGANFDTDDDEDANLIHAIGADRVKACALLVRSAGALCDHIGSHILVDGAVEYPHDTAPIGGPEGSEREEGSCTGGGAEGEGEGASESELLVGVVRGQGGILLPGVMEKFNAAAAVSEGLREKAMGELSA